MPVWRLQTSFQCDSALPRDRVLLTPHFDDQLVGSDPQGLCDDLAAGLQTMLSTFTGEIAVRAYDAQGTVPVYPQGEAVLNVGEFQATSQPRELAVCLSFYSERNLPRQRGRLYLPLFLLGSTPPGLRPMLGYTKIPELVALFTGLGGTDVDWCVFSRADNAARAVTHWWYDDDWDVQRSRGLGGSARTTGTTSEGGP